MGGEETRFPMQLDLQNFGVFFQSRAGRLLSGLVALLCGRRARAVQATICFQGQFLSAGLVR